MMKWAKKSDSISAPPVGSIQFFDHALPGLEAGTYEINVTPTLNVAGSQSDTTTISQQFTVQGPRFTLPDNDVYIQSPAPQSSGEFDTQLPYILLKSSALPWERGLSPDAQATTPWTALLVFEDGELQMPSADAGSILTGAFTTMVGEFLASASATTVVPLLPAGSVSESEKAITCQIIKFPSTLFKQIAPTLDPSTQTDELSLLAHCREMNTTNQGDCSYAVVLANRFPKAMKGCYIDILLQMPITTQPNGFVLSKNAQGTWQLVYINLNNNIGEPIAADTIEQVAPGYTDALKALTDLIGSNDPAELSSVQTSSIKNSLRSYYNQALDPKDIIKPVKNMVHLVSLEGCESYLSSDYSPEEGQTLQLVSLSSWSFICMPYMDQDFGQLLTELMTNTKTDDNIPLLRIMPPSDTPANALTPETLDYLTNGYTPHLYKTLSGETTLGWYRGPLTPALVPQISAFYAPPQNTSNTSSDTLLSDSITGDELFIYNADTGIYDVSYAAAWQTGRQMALAAPLFTQELIAFFRSIASTAQPSSRSITKQALIGHLQNGLVDDIGQILTQPGNNASLRSDQPTPSNIKVPPNQRRAQQLMALKTSPSMPIPSTIIQWLAQLRRLVGLPFIYLVPEEKLLPTESIRFFHVDTNWLDAMTAGTLTIGIHSSQNKIISGKLFDQLRMQGFNQADPVCGFFLRSAVVSGWPNLRIETNVGIATATPVTVLSLTQLAPDVLFCLLDGIPQQLTLGEPHQQLSFGVSGDTIDTGFFELRNLTGNVGAPLNPNDPGSNQLNIYPLFRSGDHRVINFSALTKALTEKGITPSSEAALFGSSDIAIELIRSPEEVTFTLPSILTTGTSKMLTTEDRELMTIIQDQSSDGPLLAYGITSTQNPIQIGEAVTFVITVDNTSITAVDLQELDILIPIGSDAADLTSDFAGLTFNVNPPEGWLISPNASSSSLIITPKSGAPQSIMGQALSITITGAVNRQVGACNFYLTEITGSDVNAPNYAYPMLSVTKSFKDFSLTNFAATPANILSLNETPTAITFTWNVTRVPGCSLFLSWGDNSIDVTDVNSYSISSLGETTTFTLNALVPTSSGNVPFQVQTTVSVTQPLINPIVGTIVGKSEQLMLGSAETLSWTTQLLDVCSLYTSGGVLVVSNLTRGTDGIYRYTVSPQQTMSYYVASVDAQGQGHQSALYQVRVYKMVPQPPVTLLPVTLLSNRSVVFGIQLSQDQKTIFITGFHLPDMNPSFRAYDVNTRQIISSTELPILNLCPASPLLAPAIEQATNSALPVGGIIQTKTSWIVIGSASNPNDTGYVNMLVIDRSSNHCSPCCPIATPPGTSWGTTFPPAIWVESTGILYFWTNNTSSAAFIEFNIQTFQMQVSLSAPSTIPGGQSINFNMESSITAENGDTYQVQVNNAFQFKDNVIVTSFEPELIPPANSMTDLATSHLSFVSELNSPEHTVVESNEVKEDHVPRDIGFFSHSKNIVPNPHPEFDSEDVDTPTQITRCCTIQ